MSGIAGARAARDGIGHLGAELEAHTGLVVGWVLDRPLPPDVDGVRIDEHQRSHVRAVAKLGVTDADPLERRRQDRPAVIERCHPPIHGDFEIRDAEEQVGGLAARRSSRRCAFEVRSLLMGIEPRDRVGAVVELHVVRVLHAALRELRIERDA